VSDELILVGDVVNYQNNTGVVKWLVGENAGVMMQTGGCKGFILKVPIADIQSANTIKNKISKMTTEEIKARLEQMKLDRSKKAPNRRIGGGVTRSKKEDNTQWEEL